MSKKKKRWKTLPLVPHWETNSYGQGVAVMWIPAGSDPQKVKEARWEQIKLAKLHSPQDPDWL